MEEKKEQKILEGGYTIERGSEDPRGDAKSKFSNFQAPVLTDNEKDVKAKKSPTRKLGAHKGGPTTIVPKHRALLEVMQQPEIGGKITKAMIAMKYSNSYAKKRAVELKQSKSWQALMDENLPKEVVATRHLELLNKRARRNIRDETGKIIEYDVDDGPDTSAVSKALEMAYKLRGAFKDGGTPSKVGNLTYNLFYNPEVRSSMKDFESNLIKQIRDEANKKIIEAETKEPSSDNGGN